MPRFELPEAGSSALVTQELVSGNVVVVAFICNHCPYVVHLKEALSAFGRWVAEEKGVQMLAISSNDVTTHPQDGPEEMARDAQQYGYTFPYLYDQSQDVARAFDAACTPDFFVYDVSGKLRYRGQFDDSRPGNGRAITGRDLRAAVEALQHGEVPSADQRASIGCNIKWRRS